MRNRSWIFIWMNMTYSRVKMGDEVSGRPSRMKLISQIFYAAVATVV